MGSRETEGPGGTPSIAERRLSHRNEDPRDPESQHRSHAAERRQRRRELDVHFQRGGGGGRGGGGRVETPSGNNRRTISLRASLRRDNSLDIQTLTCAFGRLARGTASAFSCFSRRVRRNIAVSRGRRVASWLAAATAAAAAADSRRGRMQGQRGEKKSSRRRARRG